MPPSLYQIRTRLGVFDTMTLAAAAHGVSRSTIFLRTVDDPENYQKIPKPVRAPPRAAAKKKTWPTRKIVWPLSWAEYRFNTHEEKEEIYQIWCAEHSVDPDSETTANAFFDAMDAREDLDDVTD